MSEMQSAPPGGEMDVYSRIYAWLVGRFPEPEVERLEELFASDDSAFELVAPCEEEVIRDYFAGALTPQDRATFEAKWLSSPVLRKKLQVGAALNALSLEAASRRTATPASSKRRSVPFWIMPVAAALSILSMAALGVVAVLLQKSHAELTSLSARLAQMEQIARSTSVHPLPPAAFALVPKNARSGDSSQSIFLPANEREVLFDLLIAGAADDARYRISLIRVGGEVVWSGLGTAITSKITVTVPGHILRPGDYYFSVDSWPREDRHETLPVRILN